MPKHRLVIILVALVCGHLVGGVTDSQSLHAHQPGADHSPTVDALARQADSLRAELRAIAGDRPYIVIDRSRNRLVLRDTERTLREATCATGSGKILFGDRPNQTWHFETPRRVFTVTRKVTDPIWKKPIWAFVEKNETAPVLPWEFNRLDGTTLGDYALELEDSYAIHGTLYPNLLGRSITHGCVRLDAEDLSAAYRLAEVGTRVYVF